MLPATPGQSRPHRAQGVQYLLGSKWVNFWQLKATKTQAVQALDAVPRYTCRQTRGMPWALPLSPTQKWWHTGWAQLHTSVGRGSGTWVFGHPTAAPRDRVGKSSQPEMMLFHLPPSSSHDFKVPGRGGKVAPLPGLRTQKIHAIPLHTGASYISSNPACDWRVCFSTTSSKKKKK